MAINKDINTISPSPRSTPPIIFMRPEGEKLTIMVSKRNFKTAVARNKAKRLIKEALRVVLKEDNSSISSVFLKINAQKSILDVQFQDIVALMRTELRKRNKTVKY